MNKFNRLLSIIYLVLFILIFISFFFLRNGEEKIIIFDVVQKENIIGNNLWLNSNLEWTTKIQTNNKVWKAFLLNKNTLVSARHIFTNNFNNYYLKNKNKEHELNYQKIIYDKENIIFKLKRYFNTKELIISQKFQKQDKVYTIINNKKFFWKIIDIDVNIKELNFKDLIKTNIKLQKGDSGSPLFLENGYLIWVFQIIDKQNYSYAQKITNY